jgi:hypothetical protein
MNDDDTTYIDLTDPDTGDTITVSVPYNYDDYDTSVTWGTATSGSGTYTISTTDAGGNWWDNSSITNGTSNYGKISIHGEKGTWDLEDRLKTIERALNIPERDYDMEAKHPELADLFEKHLRKVERMLKKLPTVTEYEREVEKHRMWDTLKGPDRNVDSGG